jgi:hypothetical protein
MNRREGASRLKEDRPEDPVGKQPHRVLDVQGATAHSARSVETGSMFAARRAGM